MEDRELQIALLEEVTEKLEALKEAIEEAEEAGEDAAAENTLYFTLQQDLEAQAINLRGFNTGEIADEAVTPDSKWIN